MNLAFILPLQAVLLLQSSGGVIKGHVNDKDGKPAQNVRVALAAVGEGGKLADELELVSISKTDESGNYRIDDIPRGRYAVLAGAITAPTYYPGTAIPTEARILSITPDSALLDLNFNLALYSSAPAGRPTLRGNGLRSIRGVAIQDVPGRVMIEGGGASLSLPDLFVLTFIGDAGRIETTLKPSATAFEVIEASWNARTNAVSIEAAVQLRSDGTFYLSLPDGQYKVNAARQPAAPNVRPTYFIKSIRWGSSDLLQGSVTFKAPNIGEVLVTLGKCEPDNRDRCN